VAPVSAEFVATSLIAFIIVYFAVFGAGVFYILRLMGKAPVPRETDVLDEGPLRASGIAPAPAMEASGELPGDHGGRR
jgi:cytochrome d ubiquinol oxidase subunit I